jgi:chlorite dismutase
MPERRDPPPTDEGWYALHDFRSLDWDEWRDAPERDQDRALSEVTDQIESMIAVEDSDEGATALYSILGHKADLLLVHLRPTSADIGALERQFETTAFAEYTDRETSFVSVTEASGYSERAREYFEGELDEGDGLYNYMQTRLYPEIPDATHVCFYPMDKRRDPEQNWYDLPFEERADHMDAHGDIGRDYAGKVVQMITGAVALDDHEWGVTLWGDDLVDMKDLLYEMRFDPSTSKYAEFGSFYIGRRIPPSDLPALLAGERVPTDTDYEEATATAVHPDEAVESADHGGDGHSGDAEESGDSAASSGRPEPDVTDVEQVRDEAMGQRLAPLGLHPGDDYSDGDFALALYSGADAQELAEEVDGLRGNFEHYDSHVMTAVRADGGESVIVSIWDAERAADTAEGFLTDLPGVSRSVRGPLTVEGTSSDEDAETQDSDDGATDDTAAIREELADLDVYAGKPHGEDIYALVLYSNADHDELVEEVASLRDGFDRYDTHEGTSVYEDPDGETSAVVSLWDTQDAADTASGYLTDLPGIVGWADEGEGFGTMGMFYTVKSEHREDFTEKFETVGELLADMDGHRETRLLVNTDDENDMFIASQWDSKADAMAFFRSDAFTDTVDWGRDVLADRPRHVFLA